MSVRVLFFGSLRDVAGGAERVFDPPAAVITIGALKAYIGELDPNLGDALRAAGVKAALDQALASENELFAGAREIAFLAPMSGG